MRLYGMYYACKKYLEVVNDMKVESKTINGITTKFISGWKNKSIVLNEIAKIEPLREKVRKFYETVPIVYRDQDRFEIASSNVNDYIKARSELVISMEMVINLYESINTSKINDDAMGIDMKMPQFSDIGEFSKCLQDLDFVITQCPYLCNKDADIKYGSVDVGSTWLTFFVVGTAGVTLIKNLSAIVDYAIKIKSHITTVKMQEEALRSLNLKNEAVSQMLDTFGQVNDVLTNDYVNKLENELGALADGEERGKLDKSLKKLGFWMDKGLQIYSAIDSPSEIQDLFPEQKESCFLSDDLQKLIEMKKENK